MVGRIAMSQDAITRVGPGRAVRVARKPYKCDYDQVEQPGGFCRRPIKPGDAYVEGEGDPYNIGRNRNEVLPDKYCFECAGYDPVTLHPLEEVRMIPADLIAWRSRMGLDMRQPPSSLALARTAMRLMREGG